MDTDIKWKAAFNDIRASNALDTMYSKLEFEIHKHMDLLRRDARVRVKQWLQKLRQETANCVWKRNRNVHARLLLEQLRCGRLTHPFTSLPGPGPLPNLGRWALAPYLSPPKLPRKEGAVASQAHSCPAKLTTSEVALRTRQAEASRSGSGSDALDAYCGRHVKRGAQRQAHMQSQWLSASSQQLAAARQRETCHGHGDAVLAGTKLRIQSPSAVRRADPAIMDRAAPGEDWGAAHGSSTIGLEAALGACREKALELELRLRSAEERIRLQAMETACQAKKLAKKDVDRVIDKFEKQRQEWALPHKREFDDLLQQMGDFQRATEQLKRRLSAVPSASASEAQRLASHMAMPQLGWLGAQAQLQEAPDPAPETTAAELAQRQPGKIATSQADPQDSTVAAPQSSSTRQTLMEESGRGGTGNPWRGERLSESLDALWKDTLLSHQRDGTSAMSNGDGLLTDDVSSFSAETQALLRQIHAISI